MLTAEMKYIIRNFNAGSVATVDVNGRPKVSPKATFLILDDATIAFANIRSPGTIANLRCNSSLEVCFTDILSRKAVRVSGTGEVVLLSDAPANIRYPFQEGWDSLADQISAFIVITVTAAEMILSPAYDCGLKEADLKKSNLEKLNAL